MKKIFLLAIFMVSTLVLSHAQDLSVDNSLSVSVKELPEYVIIESQRTKLIGGINIIIETKKSKYEDVLENLEDLLQGRKNLRVRTQTDLLNAMSKLGFDYVNTYNSEANLDIYAVNMVFRKKAKYRE